MTKRVIPGMGIKDDAGHYVKGEVPTPTPPAEVSTTPIESDVSLDSVHQRLLLVLDRETRRLCIQSASDPLSKDQGVAFERCVKVLREFKREEREYLEALGKKTDGDEDGRDKE